MQAVLDSLAAKLPPTAKPRSVTDKESDAINWVAAWLRNDGIDPIPHNVWIGTTVENQAMADKRIPLLHDIPAKVRFLSCEPLLESLDLSAYMGRCVTPMDQIMHYSVADWIICGGESGPNARPMDVAWARSLRDQCAAAGVPYFFKQTGGTRKPFPPIPDDLMIRQFPPAGAD